MSFVTDVLSPKRSQDIELAGELRMLELFAPSTAVAGLGCSRPQPDASLWRSDAIHRANNLAQMTASLAILGKHPARRWLPDDWETQARGLARVYEELGTGGDEGGPLPCVPLLTEVATRLTYIFGHTRQIVAIVRGDPVSLAPDQRRALVLMCSELTINALKYAFPAEGGGSISVNLTRSTDRLMMVVEDDGVGSIDGHSSGEGGELLDRLASILSASVTRAPGWNGHGFRVEVTVPDVRPEPALF